MLQSALFESESVGHSLVDLVLLERPHIEFLGPKGLPMTQLLTPKYVDNEFEPAPPRNVHPIRRSHGPPDIHALGRFDDPSPSHQARSE